jgi:urea transport system ATP-binding protein
MGRNELQTGLGTRGNVTKNIAHPRPNEHDPDVLGKVLIAVRDAESRARLLCYAPLKRADRYVPDAVDDLFPVLKDMLRRRGGDVSGGEQQLAIGRALVTRLKLRVLDEPTEGFQPPIIKDVGRAIVFLRRQGDMATILVEQYFDFARGLADAFLVTERGEVVISGTRYSMDEAAVRARIAV